MGRGKKVVIVAPVHVWNDVRVFEKEAVSLAAAGYQVSMITRCDDKTIINGVTIVPVVYRGRSRILRFLSLPLIAYQAICLRGNIYHLHNPDTLPIALFLKICGKRVVYDTHEDFTQRILSRPWLPSVLRRVTAFAVGKTEQLISKVVDFFICTQPSVALRIGQDNCIVVGNPPRVAKELEEKVIKLSENISLPPCDFRLVYIGTINTSRGMVEMVDAMEIVNQALSCRLSLVGPIENSDLAYLSVRKGWSHVDYVDRVPQEVAFSYVIQADAGLIYLRDEGGHNEIDPNKIYEYMFFCKPFIASDFQSWVNKFNNIKSGVFIPAGSTKCLADSILALAELPEESRVEMGRNGRHYVENNSWELEFHKIKSIYEKMSSKYSQGQ